MGREDVKTGGEGGMLGDGGEGGMLGSCRGNNIGIEILLILLA